MYKQPPSIFNDVIGPVMRGASSSHVAASVRIGNLARQMIKGRMKKVLVEFEPKGSLATTYHGHGSDMGLAAGLLGYETSDAMLLEALDEVKRKGIDLQFVVTEYEATHPNTYKITIFDDLGQKVSIIAISTGGGMVEIQNINGFSVSIAGDYFETIVFFEGITGEKIKSFTEQLYQILEETGYELITYLTKGTKGLINVKSGSAFSDSLFKKISELPHVKSIIKLDPVMPVLSGKNRKIPFASISEMLDIARQHNYQLWEMAVMYEAARGNMAPETVVQNMERIVLLLEDSIKQGLDGTYYKDRILGPQAWMIDKAGKDGKLIPGDVINTAICYITSLMEVKSSMGVIVAAPTAGSCGCLPGTLIAVAEVMKKDIKEITKSMLAAGIVGVFIAQSSGFAAEVGGCQLECGAGSGMAAAGLVQLIGGTPEQCIDAASIALQNILGLICDPVADRVEVPCLGKNIMAGVNSIACANMAMAGYDKVIPLDETLEAMKNVAKMLPSELKCTGYGGLSITETSKKIYNKLNSQA